MVQSAMCKHRKLKGDCYLCQVDEESNQGGGNLGGQDKAAWMVIISHFCQFYFAASNSCLKQRAGLNRTYTGYTNDKNSQLMADVWNLTPSANCGLFTYV